MTAEAEESNLVRHAKVEMTRLGMGPDSEDVNRMMYDAVISLVETFSKQGHSGASAAYCVGLVEKLLRFEPLGPLTDDPDEWMHVADETDGTPLYQCRRNSAAFSHDGGQTYYLVDEKIAADHDLEVTPMYNSEPAV